MRSLGAIFNLVRQASLAQAFGRCRLLYAIGDKER
jgi:hypothetical protein